MTRSILLLEGKRVFSCLFTMVGVYWGCAEPNGYRSILAYSSARQGGFVVRIGKWLPLLGQFSIYRPHIVFPRSV